jgi:dihydroflavonol-4-reductase
MTLGPSLGPSLNTTNALFKNILTGVFPGVLAMNWGLVDVRDAARAHVLAMENESASGRYLCAGESQTMAQVVQILRDHGYGGYKLPSRDMRGWFGTALVKLGSYTQAAGSGAYMRTHVGKTMRYDNAKIRTELGLEFTPPSQSIPDTIDSLIAWGHLDDRRESAD